MAHLTWAWEVHGGQGEREKVRPEMGSGEGEEQCLKRFLFGHVLWGTDEVY